jgi:dTDP-4-amino-4,6-dideoxygalactose transaminase
VPTAATRAILVIHEFGVPHPDLPELAALARSKEMPLIEDCAHTIDSRADGYAVGHVGDWVLVSFPKIFPIRSGGALLGRTGEDPPKDARTDVDDLAAAVAREMSKLPEYSARRRAVFARLEETARSYGYVPLFTPSASITPWFFPVRTPRWRELIGAMRAARVDAASWHGSDIVILPCHQFLGDTDIDHIGRVLQSFSGSRQ